MKKVIVGTLISMIIIISTFSAAVVTDFQNFNIMNQKENTNNFSQTKNNLILEKPHIQDDSKLDYTFDDVLPLGDRDSNDSWWNINWKYRKELIINCSQVNDNLSNFPVLISFPSDSSLSDSFKCQADGDDIVFTDVNGVKLSHEIEYFDNTTGTLAAWVNVTSLSSTIDTTLYMYYGNPDCSSQQDTSGVWDSSYMIVQHLNETSGTHYDSTVNGNDGTNSGSTQDYTGKVDGANSFDGSDDYIDCGGDSSLDITDGITIEAWVNKSGDGTGNYPGFANRAGASYNRYQLRYKTTTTRGVQFFLGDSSGYTIVSSNSDLPTSTWTHIVGTWDGANMLLFIDGVQQTETGLFSGSPSFSSSDYLDIGRYSTSNFFAGGIDELRISNSYRNSSWISTEYNNQNNPSSFYYIGNEEEYQYPDEPIISNENPADNSKDIPAGSVTLSISVYDDQGDDMDIYFRTNASGSWSNIGANTSVSSGTYSQKYTFSNNGSYYWWSVNVTDPLGSGNWTNSTFKFSTDIGIVTNPFEQGWKYSKEITINHDKINCDLTNFPVYINIIDNDIRDKAKYNGDDIIFMDGVGVANKLNHEIEYYDSTSGNLIAWVNVTSVSSISNTSFYMYYGNKMAFDMENSVGVWGSNYMITQHLNETSGPHYDSTSNGNDGTNYGSTQDFTGQLDGANSFDGSNDYIECEGDASLDITDGITIQAWVNRTGDGSGNFLGIVTRNSSGYNRYQLRYRPSSTAVQFFIGDETTYGFAGSDSDLPLNTWTYVVGTWDGTNVLLYVDGVQQTTTDTFTSSPSFTGEILEIGRYTTLNYFEGGIDEVKIANTARSACWIAAEYNNQNDPLTFINISSEQSNYPPVANDDYYTTDEDTTLNIAAPGILTNDTDPENDPLTAIKITDPTHGTITTFNSDGSFTYTPNTNYNGIDTYTYQAYDGNQYSNTATVTITITPVNDPPIANDDNYTTDEDTTLTITTPGILTNDTDIENDPITAILIDDVENGTLNLNSNGGFDYTPNTNYFGIDTFTYQAYDGNLYSNTATVTITIIGTNDPPIANDDYYTTPEETTLTILAPGILENDTDPDYETLTALLVDSVSNGTLTFKSNGSFIYNPDNGFNGEDSFTYRAYDGTVVSNIAIVNINVTPVNDPPFAYDDYYITNEDITLIISENGILDNDTDPENDILTASLVTNVTNGILNLYSNGTFEYTPNTDYYGTDIFTYRAFDGLEYSNSATVTITINPINDPPIANDDYNTTEEDTTLIIPAPGIMANDTDVENDSLTAILVSNVTHGTLTLYENGSIIYTPDKDYIGPDSFTYKINDGSNDSNTATVYLTVYPLNDPPFANDDNYSTNEDTTLNVAAPGVLANDTDPENDPLIAILVSDVSYGILNLNMNGAFDYTPNQDYNGIDTFTYQAYDGMEYSNIATVTITINPINDPPTANDDNYTTEEDTTLNVPAPGVLTNDTDPENDPLTAIKITNPTNGTITTFNSDGSFTYTPDNDYVGTDTFTYQAYDSLEYSNTATVTITITQVNDPPIANDDEYTTDEDITLTVTAPGILINDTDLENDSLTATLISDVTHGELNFNENGSFIYNPDSDFSGSDSFTYRAYDGELVSNIGTVNITINPVNDQPVANDDYYSTDEDTTINITAPGVLANDTDVENDPLTTSLVSDVTNGILNLNLNGSFDYKPNEDYYGTDIFTYRAYDGIEYSNTATVTITINPLNDPPIANDDNESVTEDSIDNQLDVLSNDNDVDGDTLNIINVTTPSHGNVTYNNDYVFYTPYQDYNGPDDFIYTITDNNGETDTAVVNITVTPQNDPPYSPSNPNPSDGQLDVDINANISWTGGDIDGDPVTYDVYFGLINPPPQIISNQTDTYYIPGTMNFTTDYYWKIVAWDNQGSSTTGPVWNFTTEGEYDWEAILTFDETNGEYDTVYFGEKITASDDQDTWDTPKDPAGSPPYIRAWFNTNFTDPYNELWKEYKHSPDDNKIWNLTIRWVPLDNSSPTEITITWNSSNFDNSEYNNIFLINNLTQESINMFVQNSYTFNASALAYYQFKIICSNKLVITGLKSNWNIISIPFNQSVSKSNIIVKYNGTEYTWQDAVSNNIVLGFIYTWIRDAPQHYELINTLKPGFGYWVYSYQPCTLLIDGASTKNNDGFITNMLKTWNIVGLPNIERLPKQELYVRYNGEFYSWANATTSNNPTGGPIILGYIYNWSRSPPQNYELTNNLNPGYGYQMYAYYNCSIYYYITGPLDILPIGDKNNLDKITSSENQINTNDNNDISKDWNIKLEFNEPGGSYDYAFFGERIDSLDAIDCFDVPKNPSGISPYIRVLFEESNLEPFDKLWRSYKQYLNKNKCWNLAVQWVPSDLNSKTTLTISWDKNSFNNCNYNFVALYDKEKNIKLVDMLVNEEHTFTCPALTVQRFTIKCYSNQPSITPNNPNPYNDEIDIKIKLNLSWSGGDPDLGDKISIKYPNQKLLIKTMTFNEIN